MHHTDREHIVHQLFDNMSAIKRVMGGHLAALSREYLVSRSQLELLSAIHHAQPVSFKELAQQLCLTPGAVSQLAENLEAHDYISRQTDPEDRRVQFLRVTAAGGKLLKLTEKRRKRMLSDVIEGLTDEELALWLRVQQKVLHRFQTETNDQAKQES